jgi:hypothetical protein
MLRFRACSTGLLNALGSVSATAMPSAFDVTAVLNAFSISLVFAVSEPVHW